ncbi:MAG: type IX secretion system sortase PorU [Muribaculaceae bacterium]|nr:type IX secretion system sortase PorU [Muribaculaceae bacterium]
MTLSSRNATRPLMIVALLLATALGAVALPVTHYARHSVLSSGTWIKVPIEESGMYELTLADVKPLGVGDLSAVRIYGGGGAPMSETITAEILDDLPQVPAVYLKDKVLFYAQGPTTWSSTADFAFCQRQHPYAVKAYYFITVGGDDPALAVPKAENAVTGSAVTTFTERVFHEKELANPGETGRNMLGENMTNQPSLSLPFKLAGLVPGSDVKVKTRFGVKIAMGSCQLLFKANGENLPSDGRDGASTTTSNNYYSVIETVKTFKLDGTNELNYDITVSSSGSVNYAYLDYVTVNYERELAMSDGMLTFAQPATATADFHYVISGASDSTVVWDVTTPWAPTAMNTTKTEDGKLLFSPVADGYREYVAFDTGAEFYPPAHGTMPEKQDLHGAATPDMIIITHKDYLKAANRLAEFHENQDGMSVLVATDTEVYNEFSQGAPDAMAYRMLCKMMWDRGVDTAGHHMQYLLLMGDGSYDNRMITNDVKPLNLKNLLTWQSDDSNTENGSYTTDDIYGVFTEGESTIMKSPMDIAVGRFPVNSLAEAQTMVDKVIRYMQTPDYGTWKNNSLNVADDQDGGIHMQQAEEVIGTARANGGESMIFNHVFIDAFPETSIGAARTFPEAKALMMSRLQEGTLWWNYTGHASPNNWGAEGMLRRNDITDNLYYDHLPVLYAATCSFAKYDALTESGSENMVLNPRGGAIVTMSPAREVLMTSNGALNNYVAQFMFSLDEKGKARRVGDILRLGKNLRVNESNKLRYILLGDPALRLALPEYRAVITNINGVPVDPENRPVFQGRQTMTLSGHIEGQSGGKISDFNGMVYSTLFDSEQSVTTHGYGDGVPFTYLERPNKLALRADTVQGGNFSISITIPSEIMATYDNYSPSLISLYAFDRTTQREASGSNTDFYIYGYDDTATADTIGPDIQFFGLNSGGFTDGSTVNDNPIVLATIYDKSGVNFSTAGVGHNMTLLLDGKTTYSDLTNYYTPEPCDEGTLGTISFPLKDIENGAHTLRLRVWDVHNNVSEKTITFNVSQGLKPELVDVYATDNPASTSTTFYVEHNRANAQMTVGIEVYDLMGRLVWSTKESGRSNEFITFPITWDLTSNGGGRVPRGIYVYRATVSTDGEHEASKAKKLAVCAE